MKKVIYYISFIIFLLCHISGFTETHIFDRNIEEIITNHKLGFGINNDINQCSKIFSFKAAEARQGVAVDKRYVYVVDNRAIGKYEKETGKLVDKWEGNEDGPIIHLDSGVVIDGKLYCAHSNYHDLPMVSSVEVWDTDSMEHIDSHSFGINWGSLTWIDWYNGYWWAVFANYSRVFGPSQTPYGNSYYTQLIKFDDKWNFLEGFIFPEKIIDRAQPMSISGGSWGADGFLYVTGHDLGEMYKIKLPEYGSILELIKIIPLDCQGQGIAWDRSKSDNVIYSIDKEQRAINASVCN